jgi:ribosomal protein L44E
MTLPQSRNSASEMISFGSCPQCTTWGQLFRAGYCAHCTIGHLETQVKALQQVNEAQSESGAREAARELSNIANAERFNRERFRDDTEFADWAQSRCRHTLSRIE